MVRERSARGIEQAFVLARLERAQAAIDAPEAETSLAMAAASLTLASLQRLQRIWKGRIGTERA